MKQNIYNEDQWNSEVCIIKTQESAKIDGINKKYPLDLTDFQKFS